jgi:1-deoxy-D-xylulose-5-phosphate synthase
MRFIKPLDEAHLKAVLAGYEAAYLVEDGARRGGLGEEVSALIQAWRLSLAYSHGGADDIFLPHASRSELLTASGLDAPGIAEAAGKLLS